MGLSPFLAGRVRTSTAAITSVLIVAWAAPLAAHHAADVRLVNLDVIAAREVPADPVAVLAHHAGAQLVQDLEGRLVRVRPSWRWN